MASTEGHFCDHCWCDQEHGCVCGWCDLTEEDIKQMFYEEEE